MLFSFDSEFQNFDCMLSRKSSILELAVKYTPLFPWQALHNPYIAHHE